MEDRVSAMAFTEARFLFVVRQWALTGKTYLWHIRELAVPACHGSHKYQCSLPGCHRFNRDASPDERSWLDFDHMSDHMSDHSLTSKLDMDQGTHDYDEEQKSDAAMKIYEEFIKDSKEEENGLGSCRTEAQDTGSA